MLLLRYILFISICSVQWHLREMRSKSKTEEDCKVSNLACRKFYVGCIIFQFLFLRSKDNFWQVATASVSSTSHYLESSAHRKSCLGFFSWTIFTCDISWKSVYSCYPFNSFESSSCLSAMLFDVTNFEKKKKNRIHSENSFRRLCGF